MMVSAMTTRPGVPTNLRVAEVLTVVIAVPALVAAAGGLFIFGLYRDPAPVLPAMRGQDHLTLIALAVIVVSLRAARRGSAGGRTVWIGLLGYVMYACTGAALAYHFSEFFLIYVALFSLSIFALVAAASGIDVAELQHRFDPAVRRRPGG